MKKSLTKFQFELNNGFNYKAVGFLIVIFTSVQFWDWRPYVGMYDTVVGKPTMIDTVVVGGGTRNSSSDRVALKLDGNNYPRYFNRDTDGFRLDTSLLKYNEVKLWYKHYRFDSDDCDFYQLEADGKMIYSYDYSIFWGKVKWVLYGILLIWFGNSNQFRERLFKRLRILPNEYN